MANYYDPREFDDLLGIPPEDTGPVFGGTQENPPRPFTAYNRSSIDDPQNFQTESDIWQARQARAFAARTARHLGLEPIL